MSDREFDSTPPSEPRSPQRDLKGFHAQRVAELERANQDNRELLARERRLREELVAADVAKDRLIGVLSHDLRSPLHAVLGWTRLLRREPLHSEARDLALATIESNARAQVRLLDELLCISRVASESLQLVRACVDLPALVHRAFEAALGRATARGVELVSACAPSITIMGDRERLDHALSTMLAHALDSTPAGGRVAIRLDIRGEHARLVVEDTGRGIPAELLSVVFDPARPSIESAPSAHAVGLYVVRRVVELHGGRIAAESEGAGMGTRVTVLLPLGPLQPLDVGSVAARRLDGVRVLVVDDDQDGRELMQEVLETHGAAVSLAADGNEALEVVVLADPHVLVTDLAMPRMDGLELARRLRARPYVCPALVLVSGYAAQADIRRALAAGFDGHLAKPIELDTLVAVVEEMARVRR